MSQEPYLGCLACYPGKVTRLALRFVMLVTCGMNPEGDLDLFTHDEIRLAKRIAEDILTARRAQRIAG